jgi:Cu-Zn family superoxide dismutase
MSKYRISKTISLVMAAACASLYAGCSKNVAETSVVAIARLSPASDSGVSGTVRFEKEGDGVRVLANIFGLSPGQHGFHIHEKGDCSAPDASSAGGHFNPSGEPHAARDATSRHAGDLGNLVAGADGHALHDFLDTGISLSGATSIVGRAVVVHAGRDDLKTQPSGVAGARGAGGVIENEP